MFYFTEKTGQQQVQWMQAPQAPVGCPPGLEYLTQVDQLLVHQQIELLESKLVYLDNCAGSQLHHFVFHTVLTGFETQNKYRVRNALGQQVYFAAESRQSVKHVTSFMIQSNTMCWTPAQ